MAKCAPKKPAKKMAVKDLATKKNPKGGKSPILRAYDLKPMKKV